MGTVVKFPLEKSYPETVSGREVWAQKEPSPEMVWAVCPYIRSAIERCKHCSPWEIDERYGEMRRGCYGMAAEACRIVFAMQNREKP